MDPGSSQQIFFQHIKAQLAPHLSLVDEIAELLDISNDSAYRRIRGEKPISFEEIQTLCGHFTISLDQFLHLKSDSIIFSGQAAGYAGFSYKEYLSSVVQNLQWMNSFEKREMFYLNKDIPIFHHFQSPVLSAFKSFFWMKTILHDPSLAATKFRLEEQTQGPLIDLGKKVFEAYYALPSQEIWNIESINSTIRQIEYYRNSGVFDSQQDVHEIYSCLEKSINHIEQQAELGFKFPIGQSPHSNSPRFKMYINEFILGDNTILVFLGENKVAYVNHSVLNYMHTQDEAFCDYTFQHIQNIIRKSTLISEVGEKERKRFFNVAREKINTRNHS
jgi:hypothetical protein